MMDNLLDEQPIGMTKDPEETIVSALYFFLLSNGKLAYP